MSELRSPYYPPRSRWYSGFFYCRDALRRRLNLDAIKPRTGLFLHQLILSPIPGFTFWAQGQKRLARDFMVAYFLAVLGYLVFLGSTVGTALFGLVVSLHVMSFLYTFRQTMTDWSLRRKIGLTGGVIIVTYLGFYTPVVSYCNRHWFMPLSTLNRTIVINPRPLKRPLERGELLAFRYDRITVGGFAVGPGFSVDPVLALPGESVVFLKDRFEINGQAYKSLAQMPQEGSVAVPKNHCFVWPTLVNLGAKQVRAEISAQFTVRASMVPEDRWVGRPFSRWFFRRQKLS
jgi:hypothetical protein